MGWLVWIFWWLIIGVLFRGWHRYDAPFTGDRLVGRLHAGHLARDLAKLTGGGGGGRPDVAEAGGKDPARIPDALGQLPELVSGQLKR